MKKLIVLLLVTGVMTLGFSTISFAQDEGDAQQTEVQAPAEEPAQQEVVTDVGTDESAMTEDQSFHQVVKEQFIAPHSELHIFQGGLIRVQGVRDSRVQA